MKELVILYSRKDTRILSLKFNTFSVTMNVSLSVHIHLKSSKKLSDYQTYFAEILLASFCGT